MGRPKKNPYDLKMRASNSVWYVEWRIPKVDANGNFVLDKNGKPVMKRERKSTDTTDKGAAEKRAKLVYLGKWQGETKVEPVADVTVAQLLERCLKTKWHPSNVKSQATYASNVKLLTTMCGDEFIRSINLTRLEKIVDDLRSKGRKEATIIRLLDTFKAALNHARNIRYPDGSPWFFGELVAPKLTADNFCDVVLSYDDEAHVHDIIKVLEVKKPNSKWKTYGYLLMWLMDTAQRIGAIRYAKTSWVQEMKVGGEMRTVLNIPANVMKGNKPHSVPLTQRCIDSLTYLRMTAIDDNLFPIMGSSTPWTMWDQIRDELKPLGVDLSDVKQHTFRHTAVTRLLQKGHQMSHVARLSKHSIKVMMARYGHLVIEDTLGMVATMNASNIVTMKASGEINLCQ